MFSLSPCHGEPDFLILRVPGTPQGGHGQNAAVLQAVGMPRHDVLFPVQGHADRAAVLQHAPDVKCRAALNGPVHNALRQKMVGKKAHVPREKAVRLQGIKKLPHLPAPLLDEQQAVFYGQRVQQGGAHAGMAFEFRIICIDSRGVGRPEPPFPFAGADHQASKGGYPRDSVLLGGRHGQNHGGVCRYAGNK